MTSRRTFRTFLLVGAALLEGCGPGLTTDFPPVITINTPGAGATVTALSQVFSGTCSTGLPLTLTYSAAISGPSQLPCASGTFNFTATLQAIAGTVSVGFTQTDSVGNVGVTGANLTFNRLPLSIPTGFGGPGFNAAVNTVVNASDGTSGLYLGGAFTTFNGTTYGHIAKLDSSGQLVTTFNSGGAGFDTAVNAILPAPDNGADIYVGGTFTGYNAGGFANIVRLTSDGTVNPTFAASAVLNGPVNVLAAAPTADATNDIYVGGSFTTPSAGIARLTSLGTTNSAFTTGVGTGFTGGPVNTIAVANDGSQELFVGGSFTTYQGAPTTSNILRIGSTGVIDATFAPLAFTKSVVPLTAVTINVILVTRAPDLTGDIYVGGNFDHYGATAVNGLVRLNSTGAISGNIFSTNLGTGLTGGAVSSIVFADTSNDLIIAGAFTDFNSVSAPGAIRLRSTGGIDSTLSIGTGFNAGVSSIAMANDGSGDFIAGGSFTSFNGTTANDFARIGVTGSINTTFGTGAGFGGNTNVISPLSDGTGDIYAGGGFATYNGSAAAGIIRLQMNGSVNPVFDTGSGFAGGGATVYAIVPVPDNTGDIYVGGDFTTYDGNPANNFARITSTGALNTTYMTAMGSGFNAPVRAIAVAAGGFGDMYVGGDFTTYAGGSIGYLIKISSSAAVNVGFSGALSGPGNGFNNSVRTIALTTAGNVVVGGDFTSLVLSGGAPAAIGQIYSLDATANPVGGFLNFNQSVRTIVPTSAGDLLVGGDFTTYGATSAFRVLRLQTSGALVSAFSSGLGFDNSVFTIAMANDGSGDAYIGGSFSAYNGINDPTIVRITSAGTLNTSFNNGGVGFDSQVNQIVPAIDGSSDIYVGGLFANYQSTPADTLARLSALGGLD